MTARIALFVAVVTLGGCARCGGSSSTGAAASAGSAAALPPAPLSIIDSHVHITPTPEAMNLALQIFSQVHVDKFAVKSAGVPGTPRYQETLRFAEYLGERMAFFTTVDWDGIDEPGWGEREAERIARAMREGASGIKIFKALGLGVRLKNGKLLHIDDSRLEPIWRRAGEVGAIVAWHVADPVAFFKPVDRNNERFEELSAAPEWSFYGQDFPSHDELLAQRNRVIERHPRTTFLGIHLGEYPENLDYVARTLDRYPNLYLDTSARLGEIGRHPVEQVRAFFVKYQDRLLFGTDLIVTPNGMQLGSLREQPPTFEDALRFYADHRRFFETADRNIDHPTPIQGRWKINAVNLPAHVLRKFYMENAERLIFKRRSAWLQAQTRRP